MKIKCNRCGKKYKDMYMQCPHCGEVTREHTTHTHKKSIIKEDDLYIQKKAALPPVIEEHEIVKSPTRPKKKMKKLRWLLLGIVGAIFVQVGSYGLIIYRQSINPKQLTIQVLDPGDTIETASAMIQVHKAQVIQDEWIDSYIPKGYKLIGLYTTGENKEKEEEHYYYSAYAISYEKNGKEYYEPTIDDIKVMDYVRRNLNCDTLDYYSSFYGSKAGYILFLVPSEIEHITFNYTHMLHTTLRGYYKGTTYEVPLTLTGGELEYAY